MKLFTSILLRHVDPTVQQRKATSLPILLSLQVSLKILINAAENMTTVKTPSALFRTTMVSSTQISSLYHTAIVTTGMSFFIRAGKVSVLPVSIEHSSYSVLLCNMRHVQHNQRVISLSKRLGLLYLITL